MSDETAVNLVEGRDAAGWYAQWQALKQEVDVLNPTVDGLQAKLKLAEQEAEKVSSLQEQLAAAQQQISDVSNRLRDAEDVYGRMRTTALQLQAQNKQHRDNIAGCFAAIAPLYKALGDALAEPAVDTAAG